MKHFYDTISTPVGDFSVALDETGSIVAAAFGGLAELRSRFAADQLVRDAVRVAPICAEIGEYFAGVRNYFTAKLAPRGTSFQRTVWSALQRIPVGETRSYGELAIELGRPGAARAIGRANATNPICLIIPCHRVIGVTGSLTGYAFGNATKHWLLNHEKTLMPIFA